MRAIILATVLLSLAGCWPEASPERLHVSGETMGTTYNVTVIDPPKGTDADDVQAIIAAALDEVNAAANNWNPGSEVSLFNADDGSDPVPISDGLARVMAESLRIHTLSGGKFDVTLAPLIDLWGFGPKKPGEPVPSDDAIATALGLVGQSSLVTLGDRSMAKAKPGVSVNLSAIAKGYGVDRIAESLAEAGMTRSLVEIGGDLAARGRNDLDEPWSIGIERPDAAQQTVEVILPVTDLGLATSGDYRNYFEEDGVRYSHIIDPTSGRPITHSTASVTVLADTAMTADGLATALLVLGGEEALTLAEARNLAVMIIERKEGGFVTSTSSAFDALIAQPQN